MDIMIHCDDVFTAYVRKQEFTVPMGELPQAALDKIMAYGLQRIFNDSAANAKSDEEALELAGKKLDNLLNGIIRASGGGGKGDPVRTRARDIAEGKIKKSNMFKAWLQAEGLKLADKAAQKELKTQIDIHAPNYMELAKAQIADEADLDIELDMG